MATNITDEFQQGLHQVSPNIQEPHQVTSKSQQIIPNPKDPQKVARDTHQQVISFPQELQQMTNAVQVSPPDDTTNCTVAVGTPQEDTTTYTAPRGSPTQPWGTVQYI